MSALLGPSVASAPGMTEWYGRLERFAASPGTALARMRAILELDVREVLPLVTAPTLVIQNLDDVYVRAGHGRYLAEHIADATLLERDSADHWPVPEPDLLAAIEEFITGTRVAEAEVDRILTTVLFVDVVGSTEHVSELGDRRWQTLLDQFVAVVQRELLTHRGVLIERAGDGILATFDGPARAIRCAWGIRDSLRRSGLEVRCGLHTGEVTQRNGDVAGLAVHIGARVSAAAAPGEVLVTRTVRDLVAGSGIEFADRGLYALKGVEDPVGAVRDEQLRRGYDRRGDGAADDTGRADARLPPAPAPARRSSAIRAGPASPRSTSATWPGSARSSSSCCSTRAAPAAPIPPATRRSTRSPTTPRTSRSCASTSGSSSCSCSATRTAASSRSSTRRAIPTASSA